eukprot:CAMPEP_0178989826 /NCGR_PEP_ID=MMETSP0795-20121207/4593_1 /TAXON_ID=88552 /ORGANISM="Amoebophrya sp., Strain Ameob2" /LENGTH=202 /DNA_ID=CAMNT_0020681277 /DNA_START=203 /DNA_END=811 /DNA_ORIENTATION=+
MVMVVLVAIFISRPVFFPVLVGAEPSTSENHAQKTTSVEVKSQAFADSTGGEDDEFSDPAGGEEDRQEVDPTFLADTRLPAPQLHHAGDESSATTLLQPIGSTLSAIGAKVGEVISNNPWKTGATAILAAVPTGAAAYHGYQHYQSTHTTTTTMWGGGSAPPPSSGHSGHHPIIPGSRSGIAAPPPRLRARAPAPKPKAGCC